MSLNKEELNKYTETKREIEIIEDKIEYLKEKKTSIKSMVITDMPRGSNSENDRLGILLGEIEELINIYNEKQIRLIKQQIEIEEAISILDDPIDRNIMRLRYLEGMKWEKICVEVNYRWAQVHRHHKSILEKICKK